ncbi:hypothetical protein WN943_023378 [Citrus x changshan-huyou]
MKLEKLKGNFSRPSRATLVPIVTLIKILSLQITKKPVLSLRRVGFSGAEGALFNPATCVAGLPGDQYLPKRKVVMSIKDFGVGDGTTSTTEVFRKAVRYVQAFGDKGGTQLNVPEGLWLTGSFILTSRIKGTHHNNDMDEWPIMDPLPSYGRGRERLVGRHISLIHVDHLTNVVMTDQILRDVASHHLHGYNGTIDGKGQMRWDLWWNRTLKHTRGHLVELMNSNNILIISNLTFCNSPFRTIHPVYCRNGFVKGMTVLSPLSAPNTDGLDPVKSGWDHDGIAMARPSSNIAVRRVSGTTPTCSGVGIGREMSGRIFNVTVNHLDVWMQQQGSYKDRLSVNTTKAPVLAGIIGFNGQVFPLPCPQLQRRFELWGSDELHFRNGNCFQQTETSILNYSKIRLG